MTKSSIASGLATARASLAVVAEQPLLECQMLMAQVLGKPRTWVLTHPEVDLSPAEWDRFHEQVNRRAAGEPLPYLLGQWDFYGLTFEVSRDVLIPRPETELVVELGLVWLEAHPGAQRAVDVGTGSGCIAAALAKSSPDLLVTAVDISAPALQVARRNFSRLGVFSQIQALQGDLLAAVRGPFGLICANLPYIPTDTLTSLPELRYEPRLALDGGQDGLHLINTLLEQATTRLVPGGRILLEIEISQATSAPALAKRYFPQAQLELKMDLSGLPRMVVIDA